MTDPAGSPDGKRPRPLPGLSEEHLALLSAAAITPDIAAAAGVYTATEIADLPPSLRRWKDALPGIVFPWWRARSGSGPVGDDDILWQLRPDVPLSVTNEDTGKTKVRKYLFPLKRDSGGAALNAHPLMRAGVHNATAPLIIVEGTKQTLAAVSALAGSEFAVVGMAGCYGWSQGGGQPIEDIQAIPWNGREVFLCLDADVTGNREVWEAADKLRSWLEAMSVDEVRLIRLPGGGTTGLDDVLAMTVDPRETMAGLIERTRAAKLKADKWPTRPPRKRSSEYFDEDGGLLAAQMATALLADHPCALAIDHSIAVYDAGRYKLDKSGVLPYVTEMLGDKHKPIYLATVDQAVTGKLLRDGLVLSERPTTALLNLRNGMLDLESLKLHPHDPEYLSATQLPIAWDPEAECPTYDSWLASVLRASQIPDIEESAGQMFDMLHTPQQSLFLFGPSRSGKSTFIRLMEAIMGKENTSGVTLHDLTSNDYAKAELYGKKLNIAADLSAKHVDDLSVWKRLTGDDLVSANRKYGSMFSFRNQALFAFAANEPPSVGESSRAYFARIRPFEFPFSFEDHEDQAIEDKMVSDELPGILRRWVDAFRCGKLRGERLPKDPVVATLFETQSDRVLLWVEEELQIVTSVATSHGTVATSTLARVPHGCGMTSGALYEDFIAWTKENNYSTLGRRKFTERLTSIDGVIQVRLNPSATRALNLIKKVDNDGTVATVATSSLTNPSTRNSCPESDTVDTEKSHIPRLENESATAATAPDTARDAIGTSGSSEPAPRDPLPPAPPIDERPPVQIDFSVVTKRVYTALVAAPRGAKKALAATLKMSMGDLEAELDHLTKGGAIAPRKPRRGYDILAPIAEIEREYTVTSQEWVQRTDRLVDHPLLKFEFTCVMCGESDDELSEYFPVCTECRQKAGE